MGTLFREVAQSNVDMEDLLAMLQKVPKVVEKPDAVDFRYESGNIEFEGLAFGHKKDKKDGNACSEIEYLFKDFNLKIEAGTTNAIVGPSGFGKTTMLHLLFRIYDPVHGTVRIDGQDVKDLKLTSFRKYISIIPQNGILFNDTIMFNLKYGNPDATDEEVMQVARQCRMHERILAMPHGY